MCKRIQVQLSSETQLSVHIAKRLGFFGRNLTVNCFFNPFTQIKETRFLICIQEIRLLQNGINNLSTWVHVNVPMLLSSWQNLDSSMAKRCKWFSFSISLKLNS